ncbi:MAG: putative MFS-type transporter YhjX [Syntrophorhabdaceae bacterium PtaU1.Bin034]|nr:MAG: putative MFS-type transporter YhjX [Syntrophorhabdaceae bacterium PtaU1.Bin034]
MEKQSRQWPFYYGWVIVAIGFLSTGVWLATRTTFSVFLVVLLDEFNWSRASAAGVQSVSFIVYTFSAPLVGTLIDRFGPRKVILPGILVLCIGLFLSAYVQNLTQLYLFYGVIVAFGVTFVSIIAISAILSHWFEKKRGLASGVAVSGMGIGTFVLVPLSQYLIDAIGWRPAFMVLAGLVFLLLFPLSALFLRHKPADLGLNPDGAGATAAMPKKRSMEVIDRQWAQTDWTLPRAVKEGRFWSLLIFAFLVIIPVYVLLIHGMKLLVDRGFDKMSAAFVIALLGVTSSAFKIFWGWLSDRTGREVAFTIGAFIMALGALCLLIVEAGGPLKTAYLFVLLFGCGWGVTAPTFMAVAADLFQGRSFGLIYGVAEGVIGLGSAVGPWLGGFTFDKTGSYQTAILISIAAALLSCPFAWLAAPRKVRHVRR